MATAVPAGVAFHGTLGPRKLIRRRANHPRDENGDGDAAPTRCWQRRLSPSPRSLPLPLPSAGVCTGVCATLLGYRPDDPLPQTAIRPNECYHSMTRPLQTTPPSGFTIDLRGEAPRDGGHRRRVAATSVDARILQDGVSRPANATGVSLGAVYTYLRACVPYRAKDITHGTDYPRRASRRTNELFPEHFCE